MTHPLVPQILQIAETVATPLGLEVVDVVLHTNKSPTVVRVDIRNPEQHTGLDDCERMSIALEAALDQADLISHAYVLEISSPGTDRQIKQDREFISFRGFLVTANAHTPFGGKHSWSGHLVGRDEQYVTLSLKGRMIQIPREVISSVDLS